ncbi:MAG: hypothetical protein ABIV51_09310 [Saprospiraceae bacterium]
MAVKPGTWAGMTAEDLSGSRLKILSQNTVNEEEKTISEFELLRYTGARVAALTIGYVPPPTGNITNLNGFVRVPDGSIYFIDIHGKAIKTGGVEYYRFEQATPSTTWTVDHNMQKRPTIRCTDNSGEEIVGEIVHDAGLNQSTITFSVAVQGAADCS